MNATCILLLALAPQTTATQLPRQANPGPDPRTPIDDYHTPGDADSVYRITKPGSYYLTDKVVGAAGMQGIEIAASNVEIDLMGFRLVGKPGSLDGVRAELPGTESIKIHGGTATGWGEQGVDLANASGSVVRDVTVTQSGGTGVVVGDNCKLQDLVILQSNGNGISGENYVTVERVSANQNTNDGIFIRIGGVIRHCSTSGNGNDGIYTNRGVTIANCSSSENGQHGVYAGGANTIIGSTFYKNTGYGISGLNGGTTVLDCTTNENGGAGIGISGASVIRGCSSSFNQADGIHAGNGGLITECTAWANGGAGFSAYTGVMIRNNSAHNNTGVGFQLSSTGNTLIQNTARGQTINYYVPSGNSAGPLVTASGYLDNSTSALANFSY